MAISPIVTALSSLGCSITHPTMFVAMFKYIFTNGWSFPFYSIIFINGLLFIISLCYLIYKLFSYRNLKDPIFLLPGFHLFLLSIPYSGYIIFTVYSLFDVYMSIGRYLIIASMCDFFWMGIWSALILRRYCSIYHWLACLIAGAGYFLYDYLTFTGGWQFNWTFTVREEWQGPVFCVLARAAYVLTGVLSKRLLMNRGFQIKLREKKFELAKRDGESARHMQNNSYKRQNTDSPRCVSKDSLIYRRAMLQKKYSANDKSLRNQVEFSHFAHNPEINKSDLLTLLDDYEEFPFFMHFFTGANDLTLSKIDKVLDHPIYDPELVGVSLGSSFELHGIAGSLALFPFACLAAFLNNELPGAFDLLRYQGVGQVPFGNDWAPMGTIIGFAVLFALRPIAIHKAIFSTTHGFYYGLNVVCHFVVLVYSIIFVDVQFVIPSAQVAGIILSAIAYGVFFAGMDSHVTSLEAVSNAEAIKTLLSLKLQPHELDKIGRRFMDIRRVLGDTALSRVLVDAAVSRDPRELRYAGNPVAQSRRLFDREYLDRVPEWGGGYPRPFAEVLEKTWGGRNGNCISLDDPDQEEVELLAGRRNRKNQALYAQRQLPPQIFNSYPNNPIYENKVDQHNWNTPPVERNDEYTSNVGAEVRGDPQAREVNHRPNLNIHTVENITEEASESIFTGEVTRVRPDGLKEVLPKEGPQQSFEEFHSTAGLVRNNSGLVKRVKPGLNQTEGPKKVDERPFRPKSVVSSSITDFRVTNRFTEPPVLRSIAFRNFKEEKQKAKEENDDLIDFSRIKKKSTVF